jgi:DNA-binding transcriptional LysR family regulator
MEYPSLSIDTLTALVAAVEHGTLKRAGRELSISGSAVYKRLRAAESSLGCQLFVKEKKGLLPTQVGQALYIDACRIVEQMILAEQKVKALNDLHQNRVRLGHSTFLPRDLLALTMKLQSHLSIKLQIEHTSGLMPILIQRVLDGTLHAAIGESLAAPSSLVVRHIVEEPILVCVWRDHRLSARPVISPQDVADESVIAVSREHLPQQHLEIEELFSQFGTQIRTVADAFSPEEALSLTAKKIGICFLPESLVANPSVLARPMSIGTLTRKSDIYVRDDTLHPVLESIIEVILSGRRGKANRGPRKIR